jgi:hypothetical protein
VSRLWCTWSRTTPTENWRRTPRYWAHVYLSRDRAKAGVKLYAQRGGHGTVRWQEHGPVSYAYAAGGTGERELYRVVR